MKNGKGVLEYSDGSKYEGYFKDDMREGKGQLKDVEGGVYVGDFAND